MPKNLNLQITSLSQSKSILFIGNALVDVFTRANSKTASSYGMENAVQVLEINELQKVIAELRKSGQLSENQNENLTELPGGGAANSARICSLLGVKSMFAGSIGLDSYGELFKKELDKAGIELKLKEVKSPTGICLYLKTEREKRIAISPSAALELSEEDIKEEDIINAEIIYIDGFLLGRKSLVEHVIELVKKHSKTIALDFGSVYYVKNHGQEVLDYIKDASSILFMNEEEANALSSNNLQKFFTSISNGNDVIINVKLGPLGALSFKNGIMYKAETEALENAEATGAGDAFSAGFLYAYLGEQDISICLEFANKTARLVLAKEGVQLTKEDLIIS